MADLGIFTKNADIVKKAGNGANTTAITTAETDKYVLQVEATINSLSRQNWSDRFATLGNVAKDILTGIGSDLCAINVIQYDMSGYTSRSEAEDMINILRDSSLRGLSILKDKKNRDYLYAETSTAVVYTSASEVLAKAGNNVSATSSVAAYTTQFVREVEGMLNVFCRHDWNSAIVSGLNADVQGILEETTSCLAAIYVIQWDMSGFTSRNEAVSMINVLRDTALKNMSILRDKKVRDFIEAA